MTASRWNPAACRPDRRTPLPRIALAVLVAALIASLLAAVPLHAQSSGDAAHAEEAFGDALGLYQDRLYGSAQEAFADFYATFPENPHAAEALFYEARALLALGQRAAAARRLERLQADYPAHPLAERAQLRLGRYFFEQGAYDDARQTLMRVLERQPHPDRAAPARFLLGTMARRRQQPDEALEQFRAVVQQYPDAAEAPQALYQIASIHLAQGRTAEAADALERLARRYPDAPQAQTLGLALAEVYFDLERYDEVLSELERRRGDLQASDERARAVFLRAEALRRLDRLADAAEAYRQYLEQHAGQRNARAARYGLALTHYRRQDYARAADLFARAAEASSSTREAETIGEKAAYLAAASRAEAGQPQAAASAFGSFLERFPDSDRRADARYRQGRALLAAGQPEEAARVLGRLVNEVSDFEERPMARYLYSRALTAAGRPADALEALEAALAAGLPSAVRPQAFFERGRLLLQAGRYDEAADAFAAYQRRFSDDERTRDALYWEAESRYQAGSLPQAAAAYQRYLRQQPDGTHAAAAQYGLAWASFQQENYEAAARAFERFLEAPAVREPNSTYRNDALLRLGDSYYARRRFAEAEAAYARARGEARDYALYQTGQVRARAGDHATAIETWQELLRIFPQSDLREEARFQIGQSHFQEQRYEAAVRAWRALLEMDPGGTLAAKAQYSIGDALYNAGRPAAAARAYRAVLERFPDSPFASDAASGVQYALMAQGDEAGAEALADSLEAADPEAAAELRFRQAEAQYQRGQFDEARRAFQRFVRTSTNEALLPQAYYYLGTLYADAGQYREAEGYLRQVLRDYPGSDRRADAAGRLGALYLAEDRPQRALEAYEQMEQIGEGSDRTQARARYGQGRALAALNRPEEAEARLREAIERAPEARAAQEARVALARLYEDTGRLDEARALYRRVAGQSRGAPGAEALYRLGALLLQEDQPEAAVEELTRLPDLFAGFPDWIARSLLAQARAYRQLDRPGQAAQLYDRLQEEFAGTEYADIARRERDAL